MKAVIIQFTFGVMAFDEQNTLLAKVLLPKKPEGAAKSIMKAEAGKISDELLALLTMLQNADYDAFAFENANIASEARKKLNIQAEVLKTSEAEVLRVRMKQIAIETGFVKDAKEFSLWNRNVSIELAKLKIKGISEKKDMIVAQAIQTLDDLDRTVNLFMGRLREWYGIHFPELDRLIEKHETYARLILNLGYRDNFSFEALHKESIPDEKAEITAKMAEKSMGADIEEQDLAEIQALCRNVLELYNLRKNLENYVDGTMEDVAPNVKAIAGSLLGARLIAMAGSLQNLAMRPASTVQVLGAEKALFRSLKTGARPPKHGLIFQHSLLHEAKRWQRGKIARVLAGKLTIAARADAFGGRFVGDALKADVDKRMEEIFKKYKEPPSPKKKKLNFKRGEQGPDRRKQLRREQKRRKKRRAFKG